MKERRICIGLFDFDAETVADGVAGVYVPDNVLVTQISIFGTVAGTPGTATIDVQDDGTDVITAQAISTDTLADITDVSIAAGSLVEIDLNLAGGTSPTFTGQIALWGFVDE